MNVDYYFNEVIVNNRPLSTYGRKQIIKDINIKNLEIPLRKRQFTVKQLKNFEDDDLILYICQVYEMYAIKFFMDNSKIVE